MFQKPLVCHVIRNVDNRINNILFGWLVKWPNNVNDVHQFHGMPLVCGIVAGTLIKIDAPNEHEAAFIDRHGKYNVSL